MGLQDKRLISIPWRTIKVGTRVQLRIRDVPRALVEARDPQHPLVVYGLLQHEHKQSVLHFAVQRNTEYEATVRAKVSHPALLHFNDMLNLPEAKTTSSLRSQDPLILCVGPRRYRINPLYSQHTRGGGKGVNNVHKSERYLRHGTAVVATTYGPVVFGKQSCLLLRESEDLECTFCAFRSLARDNPLADDFALLYVPF